MNAPRLALALTSALALSACASAPDRAYPSLALRDAERATGQYPQPTGDCLAESGDGAPVQGTLDPVAPAPAPPPPPSLSRDLVERVAQLEERARAADADFEAALPAARSAMRGRGAVGSKSWGRAQVAFANLRSIRARTAIPLGDLDTLVATRSVAGEWVAPIVDARDNVARMVERQDAALAELAPD